MRFATYEKPGDPAGQHRVGVVDDGVLHQVRGARSLLELLQGEVPLPEVGEAARRDPADVSPVAEVRLHAPVPVPPSVRDFMTFEEHIAGSLLNHGPDVRVPRVWYRQPVFYFTNPNATVGPHDDVPMPPGTKMLDFELEVAAVIGRAGSNLTVDEARDHIAGYTIFNDWSARDIQTIEMSGNLGPAKGKDTATTMGPYLVTADELEPRRRGTSFGLEMVVELNGERFGADQLDNMAWSFEQLVAYASRGTRLVPGDVLGSGTCAMGCIAERRGREGAEAQRMLVVGDEVRMRVEGLGEICNRIVEGQPLHDIGAPNATPPR